MVLLQCTVALQCQRFIAAGSACACSEALCSYKEHSELSLLATLSCILYSATALQCCSCTQCWPITYCCCRASTYLGYSTICTTRCGFVNVAFGFAARKASRHQLHKHVNAHVYLDVWRSALNSVQAVVGVHMLMSINRFAWHTFVFPDLGSPNWILRIADIMLFRLWKHIFTFTLISCTVKSGLWVWATTASIT